jgi:hypothetical protein
LAKLPRPSSIDPSLCQFHSHLLKHSRGNDTVIKSNVQGGGNQQHSPVLEQASVNRDIAASIVKIANAEFEGANNKGRAMTLYEAVTNAVDETSP